jgi:hypothetical protein
MVDINKGTKDHGLVDSRARRVWVATSVVIVGVVVTNAATASKSQSQRSLITQITVQAARIQPPRPGSVENFRCNSLKETGVFHGCAGVTPGAVGKVRAGFAGLPVTSVVYTVFPDAASARAWFAGSESKPSFSTWRLKQLNVFSVPHPRVSGRVPGLANSVIVESAGHKTLDRKGLTEANILSGNVIVNATAGSKTSTRHGNRVEALRLVRSAFAALGAARHTAR